MRKSSGLTFLILSFLFSEVIAAENLFARLAEGFTSRDMQTGITAAQRMFSVPDYPEMCAPHKAPVQLVVVNPQPVQLVRGQWFRYDQLIIVAVDYTGTILSPVPIIIDVEEIIPEVLNLRSDMAADPEGRVFPMKAGEFLFRVRTECEGHDASVIINARVMEP